MLFGNTFVAVSLNGSPWEDFRIERGGVHQGCPLVPHLFLIVKGVLMYFCKTTMAVGRLKGIIIPRGKKQQCIF